MERVGRHDVVPETSPRESPTHPIYTSAATPPVTFIACHDLVAAGDVSVDTQFSRDRFEDAAGDYLNTDTDSVRPPTVV